MVPLSNIGPARRLWSGDFVMNVLDPVTVLSKPLMAHLATSSSEGPRDSPVWYHWEESKLWVVGTSRDSFPQRLRADPRCAIGIVDFDVERGLLLHVGIRGVAQVQKINVARLHRLLARYLGSNPQSWSQWFVQRVVEPLDLMIEVTPQSIVARDYSYFRTGPDFATPPTR